MNTKVNRAARDPRISDARSRRSAPARPRPHGTAAADDGAVGATARDGPPNPLAQRLARYRQSVLFGQLLGGQCRAEIPIALAHDRQGIITHAVASPIVRLPTTSTRPRSAAIALAHRNQSHPQSPTSSKRGESDIHTLQDQDTLTLRLECGGHVELSAVTQSGNLTLGYHARPRAFFDLIATADRYAYIHEIC